MVCSGGIDYGNADLPCELGSGTEGPNQTYGQTVGGGIIGNFSSFVHAIIAASGPFSVINNRVNCIFDLSTHPLIYLWSIHFILFKLGHCLRFFFFKSQLDTSTALIVSGMLKAIKNWETVVHQLVWRY